MNARILLIDNYDSFSFNVVQALRILGAEVTVRRNDALDRAGASALAPTHLVISPGPGTPAQAGISSQLIEDFAGRIPVLGICLGHQCIVTVFGGVVGAAQKLMHGKTSEVRHDGRGLFSGLENPLVAGRYHSLAAAPHALPDTLQVSAQSADGEIMGVRHARFAVEGVQFHPESILTPLGDRLLENFLRNNSGDH